MRHSVLWVGLTLIFGLGCHQVAAYEQVAGADLGSAGADLGSTDRLVVSFDGSFDRSSFVDSMTTDIGIPDTTPGMDILGLDTSPLDALRPDTSPPDTSSLDTSPLDTSPLDTSPPDTSPPDTSRPDTVNVQNLSLIFITSEVFNGDFGSGNADSICDRIAKDAQLQGSFQALISDSSKHAGALAPLISYPVMNTQAQVVEINDLWDGQGIDGEIFDEAGATVTHDAWTGSTSRGEEGSEHCEGWTTRNHGLSGVTSSKVLDGGWLGDKSAHCNQASGLYCLRVGF
ncbi:MAG: hypothetical protein JRH20_17090 [Deltaproteobacteria bacterium]|nr:hypothetical protein [Deltaproteobacteria bacterium]